MRIVVLLLLLLRSLQSWATDCKIVGQSANGDYLACRELHPGKIAVIDRNGREVALVDDFGATTWYVADDGTSLLRINLYRYSPIYLTLTIANSNITLRTDQLLRILKIPQESYSPPFKPHILPLVVLGKKGESNAALLYFREQNKLVRISSAGDIDCLDFDRDKLGDCFFRTAVKLLSTPKYDQVFHLRFRAAGGGWPVPFWKIEDALSFVRDYREEKSIPTSIEGLENSMLMSATWVLSTDVEALKVNFPVAHFFHKERGKAFTGEVRAEEVGEQMRVRLFTEKEKEIGCVVLDAVFDLVPKNWRFRIECEWMPFKIDHLLLERRDSLKSRLSTNIVVKLPNLQNTFEFVF